MRILLIEDDRKAARLLAKGLLEEGFVVDVAPTGEDGEEKATVNEYDVIVLDWLLPGKDGLAVCRALRDRKSTRLNSSHTVSSYAVFCLKKKKAKLGSVRTSRACCVVNGRRLRVEQT